MFQVDEIFIQMGMLQTYDNNVGAQYLNESLISQNCRKTLNKERFFDPHDSYSDLFGLP